MGLFNFGGKDPSHEANKYYSQIPGATQGYFQPYAAAGQDALGTLQGQYGSLLGYGNQVGNQYGQLMNDPGQRMNQIGSSYQQSPGYQFALDQALQASGNAAAAGGMAGSPQHEYQNMQIATGLANQDYYNYLSNALGMYNTGLQGGANLYGAGLSGEQNLNQMGYNANDQIAKIIADSLSQQGNLAYSGANYHNQNTGRMIGNLGALAYLAW